MLYPEYVRGVGNLALLGSRAELNEAVGLQGPEHSKDPQACFGEGIVAGLQLVCETCMTGR